MSGRFISSTVIFCRIEERRAETRRRTRHPAGARHRGLPRRSRLARDKLTSKAAAHLQFRFRYAEAAPVDAWHHRTGPLPRTYPTRVPSRRQLPGRLQDRRDEGKGATSMYRYDIVSMARDENGHIGRSSRPSRSASACVCATPPGLEFSRTFQREEKTARYLHLICSADLYRSVLRARPGPGSIEHSRLY